MPVTDRRKAVIWIADDEERLFESDDIARIRGVCEVDVVRTNGHLGESDAVQASRDAELVISTWGAPDYTTSLLDQCPRLRFFGRVGGSVRSVIDASAWDRGVKVVTAADAQGVLLADLTVTLMLAGLHRLPFYVRQQWGGAPLERIVDHQLVPQQTLVGKRIGLLGFGSIGRHVARLLRPFSCVITAYDPHVADAAFTASEVIRASEANAACDDADIVSIHAAFDGLNGGLLGAEQIARLKHGALVVNTSYGELIDMDALGRRLAERSLFACLDMVTGRMPGPLDVLRYYPTCQITPTISHYSDGVPRLMGRQVIDEAIRFTRGEPLRFEVPKSQLSHRA